MAAKTADVTLNKIDAAGGYVQDGACGKPDGQEFFRAVISLNGL